MLAAADPQLEREPHRPHPHHHLPAAARGHALRRQRGVHQPAAAAAAGATQRVRALWTTASPEYLSHAPLSLRSQLAAAKICLPFRPFPGSLLLKSPRSNASQPLRGPVRLSTCLLACESALSIPCAWLFPGGSRNPEAPACMRRLARAYPIGAADLIELQNTVYRVFNQSEIVVPGSLLGNATSLQAATQTGSGGCARTGPLCAALRCPCRLHPCCMRRGLPARTLRVPGGCMLFTPLCLCGGVACLLRSCLLERRRARRPPHACAPSENS